MKLKLSVLASVLLPTMLLARHNNEVTTKPLIFENSGQYLHNLDPLYTTGQEPSSPIETTALSRVESFINGAQQSLTMELYELRHPRLKDAIIKALERGVRVRIVMEPDPVGGGCDGFSKVSADQGPHCQESQEFSARFLAASSAQRSSRHRLDSGLRFFNKQLCKDTESGKEGFCFQHGKLMIRDHDSFLLSSGNFNESNLCTGDNLDKNSCYRDLSVVIEDSQAAKGLEEVVELDYSVSSECNTDLRFQTRYGFFRKPSKGRCAASDQMVDVESHNNKISKIIKKFGIQKYITVNPLKSSSLSEFFKLAKKSIRIQTQYIKQQEWQDTLIEAMKNKVKVYLTLPSFCHFIQKDYGVGFLDVNTVKGKYGSYSRWIEPYEQAGKDLFSFRVFNKGIPDLDGSPMGYQHAKLVIVDDTVAWLGSTNGSLTSTNFNREFGIIFDNPEVVSYLVNIAKRDHMMGMTLEEHIPNIHSLDYSMWIRTPGTCKIYDKKELLNRKRKNDQDQGNAKRLKP